MEHNSKSTSIDCQTNLYLAKYDTIQSLHNESYKEDFLFAAEQSLTAPNGDAAKQRNYIVM